MCKPRTILVNEDNDRSSHTELLREVRKMSIFTLGLFMFCYKAEMRFHQFVYFCIRGTMSTAGPKMTDQ